MFLIKYVLALACFVNLSQGFCVTPIPSDTFKYPFYAGISGGYAMTTWDGLVPKKSTRSYALSFSMPEKVQEGGGSWGLFLGYEIFPFFALEGTYLRFPNAKIIFDSMSLFTFEHDGLVDFKTKTELLSFMGKFMILLPKNEIRAFSSLGIAKLHRKDVIIDQWIVSPTFGVGFNYNVTPRWMVELAANYTTGQGKVELSPTEHYFPFLYTVFLRVGYRF